MTDKEKLMAIKAEIERLRHDWPKVISDGEKNHLWMYFRGLNRIRDFIDSLPEEPKPKFRKGNKVIYLNEEYVVEDITDHYILRSTRERTSVPVVHIGFGNEDYELRLVEEPVSEELEKAAERDVCGVVNNCSAIGMPNDHIPSWVQDAMINEFIHGAKWKEEQIMDNIVLETEVLRDSDGDGVDTPYGSWLTLANTDIPELPESLGLEEGDKVKVIIVK